MEFKKVKSVMLLGLLCLFVQQSLVLGSSDEAKLMKHLLSRYEEEYRYTRPVESSDDTLDVSIGLSLIDIQDFEFDTGRGEFYFYDKWTWNDVHVEWDPRKFGGLTSLRVPIEKIWRPDVVMYDNRDMVVDRMDSLAVVYSSGKVLWIPRSKYHGRCMEDDDTWTCGFKMGSWTYDGYMINLNLYGNNTEVDVTDFRSEHRWEVVDNEAKTNTVFYDCCPEPYPNVHFSLKLKSLTSASTAVAASTCLALLLAAIGRALWL